MANWETVCEQRAGSPPSEVTVVRMVWWLLDQSGGYGIRLKVEPVGLAEALGMGVRGREEYKELQVLA